MIKSMARFIRNGVLAILLFACACAIAGLIVYGQFWVIANVLEPDSFPYPAAY